MQRRLLQVHTIEAFQRNDYISLNDTITTGLTNIIQLILLIVWKSIYVYYFYVATMLVLTIINNILNLRSDSTTYGKWYGVTLSAENKKQFLIPEGFAHGFLVLSDEAEFCYKVNDFWHPNDEGGMAWNDPEIGIEWPQLKGEYKGSASAEGYTLEDGTALNLSDKDQKWLGLKDTFKF